MQSTGHTHSSTLTVVDMFAKHCRPKSSKKCYLIAEKKFKAENSTLVLQSPDSNILKQKALK